MLRAFHYLWKKHKVLELSVIIILTDVFFWIPVFAEIFKLRIQTYNTFIISWILKTRNHYLARFTAQLALCHPPYFMIFPVCLVNSFFILTLAAVISDSKNVLIIRNDLLLLEMSSIHSKTLLTLLALRPLYSIKYCLHLRVLCIIMNNFIGFLSTGSGSNISPDSLPNKHKICK